MKNKETVNLAKEVYAELRTQSWGDLWNVEVPVYETGSAAYRLARVGLVRAIGVVAAKRATREQKALTQAWLIGLLKDPEERVRRYAMAALPKLGGNEVSERALLDLLDGELDAREMKHLSQTLDKLGSEATLERLQAIEERSEIHQKTEQKVKAKLARVGASSEVRLNKKITKVRRLRIHLRTRRGLQTFVRDEILGHPTLKTRLDILKVSSGCVAVSTKNNFALSDLYQLRTFGSVNFVLGIVPVGEGVDVSAFAKIIASPLTQRLCRELTEGASRYRLEFVRKKVSRNQLQAVASEAFALCPDLLNDPRQSPWAIDVYSEKIGDSVELRPRIVPDPRFLYRVDDVPASTHPPLAVAMVQLAGPVDGDVVWDPCCGSGMELVECARRGKLQMIVASDIDAEAVKIARLNLEKADCGAASLLTGVRDFRDFRSIEGFEPGTVSLIITNPPLGRRIRVADMPALFKDFFKVAVASLRVGGRLVILNPLKIDSPSPSLKLESRSAVDVGGFDCRLEKWVKV